MYVHELTEVEQACGVTMERVQALLPKGAFFGELFALPAATPPALGQSTARAAFGADAEFSHINSVTGYICYRRAHGQTET